MFRWNIAKSAEAIFSRWAIKRVCKFLLKKKLGQFILGDIDLNQLDVQLTAGTIQLADLALNVDYLNQKFGTEAAIYVKEGSIGSLLVTMPWKGKGCEVEVEELELVLAPCGRLDHQFGYESCISRPDGNNCSNLHDTEKAEHDKAESAITSSSIDVHEGVKTIAKFVKWLLTSFHVRVRKLIVAFDSLLLENEKSTELQRTLVLRFTEVEFGACISEEFSSDAEATGANFLGLNRLTNFVKFKGAMLEFLHMNGEENDNLFSSDRERTFAEFFSTCCPSTARTPVLTGERDGISGTLKLSIPWKNGSLNIRKVEADAYIDPLELKFQPSSIKWFLCLWDIVNNVDKNGKTSADSMTMGSVYSTATSHYSSSWGSTTPPNDKALGQNERPAACCSPVGKEVIADALLPESQLISDWVRFATNNSIQKDGTGEEPDFGASVEQFFECFDGMRNSQSALGNSGMWNWTCSVFSAITAASSLASGSLQVPCEQQHVETNLKATIAGVSVLFSLTDGVQPNSSQQKSNQVDMGPRAHYLMSSFRGIHLIMQVCPQDVNFGAKVESIDLTDGFTYGDDELEFGMHDRSDVEDQMLKIQQMQVAVEDTLPPFFPSAKNAGPGGRKNCECIFRDDVVKASLFKTSGATEFQLTVHSGSSAVKLTGPTSFSLKFPPFNLWVNFHLINMIAGLFKDSSEMGSTRCLHSSKDFSSKDSSSSRGDLKRSSHSLSSNELMRGVMFLPAARIILCFPCGNDEDLRNYYSFDQFIVLDFSSPSPLNEGNAHVSTPTLNASPYKRDSPEISRSLHLNMGNLDIYLLSSTSNSNAELVAGKVLSARSRSGNLSVMSLLWQENSVADHELIKKAKLLATAEDSRGRSRHVGKGYEFASVTTAKDVEDSSNCIRRDMISSSSFFLHACLSPLKINLSSSQYKVLHSLLLHAIDKLVPNENKNEPSLSQTSILVDCDSAEISVSLEMDESVKGSIEKELAGSWHHFRLQIKKFQLLSVSNIGGISGANFLWAAHGEGNLWGSITGVPEEELLLITCSNSAMGRGDGEGSNVLSSKFSGSDIIHLWDPDSSHDYMSITIRCGTIVAMGGRLDWFERVSSFFCLQSSEIEQTSEHGSKKRTPIENISCESSFILNLVDVGLSYEPYIKGLLARELSHSEFSTRKAQGNNTSFVACLLAASSVKLSNSKLTDYIDSDYKIVAQDLGLLLCTVSGPEKIIDIYSTEHLHKAGYVKVARDPHIEAILRIFSEDAPRWKLDCSGSHILLDSCHDTTSGLICLLSQLQQLFAPDLEESFVHLQNRWNNVQKAQRSDGTRTHSSGDFAPLTSQVETSHLNTRIDPGAVNLMDEISEDEFHFDRFLNALSDSSESEIYVPVDETINVSDGSRPLFLQESFLEFIEGYFLTELSPTSELFVEKQQSKNVPICKPKNTKMADAEKAKNGWYGDNSLIIMDNHVSDVNTQTHLQQLVADEATTSNCNKTDGYDRLRGCISFNNISICWKMYAGSDWHKFQESVLHSASPGGRDRTTCLELVLSGAGFKYEIYPEGEIRVSRLCLTVQDFLLNDTSHEAPWKLVLGYYQSKDHPRKSLSKAFKLDLESVRPDPLTPLEEYRLRIAFLPMLLHLHQSQLDFLISFFGGKDSSAELASNAAQDLGGIDIVSKNGSTFNVHSISEEALLPYFQKFDLWPVLVRVDYIPCRVDLAALKGGKFVELVNLVPWKGVELKLKPVHSVGVYGWSSVCETIIGEWLEDISQNQVHKLLQGLPPIRSLVAVGSGATKLVTLPMESYKKDHRVLKGMQRGITAFLRSISLEAVGLGVHLAAGAHDILLQAEYVLTSIPPSVCRTKTNVRSNQPENARQGIKQACKSIGDGLSKTTTALVRTPLKKYQRGGGAGSALATAIQAAPAAAIAPASATARAVHCALLGVRNSLDPEHKKESIEKYLGATQLRGKFAG